MNQCNWIGIILGATLYEVTLWGLDHWKQPRNTMFAVAALLMAPVVLFYRPQQRDLGSGSNHSESD